MNTKTKVAYCVFHFVLLYPPPPTPANAPVFVNIMTRANFEAGDLPHCLHFVDEDLREVDAEEVVHVHLQEADVAPHCDDLHISQFVHDIRPTLKPRSFYEVLHKPKKKNMRCEINNIMDNI